MVVAEVCVSASRAPCASRVSRQTTTLRLCTSMPAQRSNTMSMTYSPSSRSVREGQRLAPCDGCSTWRPRGAAREPHGHRNEQHLTYALALDSMSASVAAASGSCRCPGPTVQRAWCTQSHADLCVAPSPVQPSPFSCLPVSAAHDYCSGRTRVEQDSEDPTSALETGCTENPCRVRVGRRVVDTSGGEPMGRGPGRSPETLTPRKMAAQLSDR